MILSTLRSRLILPRTRHGAPRAAVHPCPVRSVMPKYIGYRALFRHRLTAHPEWNNPALSYFSSHHKECPFCLCFVSRYRHFLNDTTSACFHAYRNWEASGATAASLTHFLGSVPPCSPARAADAIWQAIRLHEPTKNRALLQQRMAALAPALLSGAR